jgi:hypothetical protein
MTPDEREDSRRDALAIMAGALRDDDAAVEVVVANCDLEYVTGALVSMVFELLRDRDISPAEWVADQQARALFPFR